MQPSTLLFIGAVAISAGFALLAAARDDRPGFALFKPITTFIILLGAAWLIRPGSQPYRGLVVLGLALSLAGDVLLLPRPDRFAAGLAAFLLAHLAYLAAFTLGNPIAPGQLRLLVPFLVAGAAVTRYVWSDLGALRVPVLAYVTVLCAMAWRAAARGRAPDVTHASYLCALAGASLFVASDAILAVRRFRHPSREAHALELAAYWAAQTLIALSVRA
ncbi:MAG TPA: lysoplasmalogenase [Gemmatimonadales bacterium]|nr:lysoplasmalogenase [Gemmatimonadales bacterium]